MYVNVRTRSFVRMYEGDEETLKDEKGATP